MTEGLKKLGVERNFFNLIKDIYEKPIADIILSSERLNAFPLGRHTRQGCPFLPFLFNIILEVPEQLGKKKVIQIGMTDVNVSLFIDGMILYIEIPKEFKGEEGTIGTSKWG